MGSNVVDVFFRLRGRWTNFLARKATSQRTEVVGGVTLNHLTWASSLGVPTALAALQGEDEPGRSIRAAMQLHNVSSGALAVRAGASSSVSHVMLEASGARTILMAPHATAQLSASEVNELFVGALDRVRLVTTEVSQVPLDGVTALLSAATARKIPTVLDVDVPPSIAAGAAQLCESAADVLAVSRLPTVLKTTRTAALELLALDGADAGAAELSLDRLAVRVQLLTSAPLVAVTDGEKGGALASAAGAAVALPPPPTGVAADSLDTTGAGEPSSAVARGALAARPRRRRGNGGAAGDGRRADARAARRQRRGHRRLHRVGGLPRPTAAPAPRWWPSSAPGRTQRRGCRPPGRRARAAAMPRTATRPRRAGRRWASRCRPTRPRRPPPPPTSRCAPRSKQPPRRSMQCGRRAATLW